MNLQSSLLSESKSLRKLSAELRVKEYEVSHVLAEKILHEIDCNLKNDRKKN